MYNVFTDFHHASLLQSFILFFEGRLGGDVFRPIGKEWHDKGYWKVYDHPATVEQFLGINGATPDGTPPLNQVVDVGIPWTPGIYSCHDIDSDTYNKAITFDAFMRLDINIVIASLPYHVEPFKKLCELHPNKPKLIYQIGNTWDIAPETTVLNVMASANISYPAGVHYIQYHQEFDLNIFYPSLVKHTDPKTLELDPEDFLPPKNIYSFVNVFNNQSHLASDWELFKQVEQAMGEWRFKSYGGQCRDGAIGPAAKLADTMREARFIWHTKAGGDGYGHVVHNSAAVARPMIVKKEYYTGKLGGDLMIDGQTCITIDGLSVDEIVKKIELWSYPDNYAQMCARVYDNFVKCVDFDKEARELKLFMADLK